jgi:eukaryotic-like serine/threonine-protein kinase
MSKPDLEKWQQVKDLFDVALARPVEERAKFLERACAGDEGLRREIESLLASDEEAESFMEAPAIAGAAQSLLGVQVRLSVGQQISYYKITRWVGQGGMGEVYLAHDTELDRKIALKLLPVDFASDKNRVRRFQQEARAASALNHPNVCVIHQIGRTDDGRHFIAMEYVEGVTLRQQMAKKRLELSEALEEATQVAGALMAAHSAGIVHRDIKPENVMVRSDALVKVLDFGLAKRTARPIVADTQASASLLVNTEPGMVMGTVAYMSPEQARGLEVDARTDIWSLGVVLYEMVTGRAPFEGATASDLIVSVLEREPLSLTHHLPEVPAELQRIVSKALRKEREERYEVVKDLFLDLKTLKQGLEFEAKLEQSAPPDLSSEGTPQTGSRQAVVEATADIDTQTNKVQAARTTSSARYPSRKPLFWTAGVLGGLLLLAVAALYFGRSSGPPPASLVATPLTTEPGFEGCPSLSSDGSQVAFGSFGEKQDNLDIYVKLIGGGPPLRLTSDPAPDQSPAWSPDGRSIAFIRDRGNRLDVLLIPALGGPERKLAEIVADLPWPVSMGCPYLSWSPDSKYLVTIDRASAEEPAALFVLSVATGERRRLTTPPATAVCDAYPAVAPDGRTLAFVRLPSYSGHAQLYVLPLSEGCRAAGEPQLLELPQPWVDGPAWTSDGQEIICTVSQPGLQDARLWRVPVSRSKEPQPLASIGEHGFCPTISRQGNRLVYGVGNWNSDIWRAELSAGDKPNPAAKLIASTRDENVPQYSPDGSRIAFSSHRSGHDEIWVCNGDGSKPAQLTSFESSSSVPRWFPDGRRIVFNSDYKEEQTEIYLIDTDNPVPRRLTNDPSDDGGPSVSQDGKWIYFSSRRTGRFEIWRMPAQGGAAVQLTHNGGSVPLESPDGKVVYYQTGGGSDVWEVPVAGGEERRVLGPAVFLAFAVVEDGIYFIEPGPPRYAGWIKGNSLKFFSFAKGTAEKVFDIKYWPDVGLAVSPDRRYALFSQIDAFDPLVWDLMLVENFR